MVSLVPGQFGNWSHDEARQKALQQAAARIGTTQGYMGKDVETRPEFDYGKQAYEANTQAAAIRQASSKNASNNSVIESINRMLEEQRAKQQAEIDAEAERAASLAGSQSPVLPVQTGADAPRLGAYLRALRKSNDMGVDSNEEGSLGTYGMDSSVLANKSGGMQGGWDRQALGRDLTTKEFLGSKKLQTKIARYKFGKYLDKYGETGALTKWLTKTQPSGTPQSIESFLDQFFSQMKRQQ